MISLAWFFGLTFSLIQRWFASRGYPLTPLVDLSPTSVYPLRNFKTAYGKSFIVKHIVIIWWGRSVGDPPSGILYYYSNFIHIRIPIFWLVDLYHVTLGYDATTSLTSLSWCNSRGVNSIHHCHYTMASADSKFDDFCLQSIQFE